MRVGARAAFGGFCLAAMYGCDGQGLELELVTPDEVVTAPARSVRSTVIGNATCEALWNRAAGEIASAGDLLGQRNEAYPVAPWDLIPEGVEPRAGAIVHVSLLDADGLVVARGCGPFESEPVSVTLTALPPCAETPPALDLAVVYDASEDMVGAEVQFGGAAQLFRTDFADLLSAPEGSSFSLYPYGPSMPDLIATRTSSAPLVGDAVEALGFVGTPDLFTSMARAARSLRHSASCKAVPALLVVAAGRSIGGLEGGSYPAEATFSLYASQLSTDDDIYAFGIGLSADAIDDLSNTIPPSIGEVRGADTGPALTGAYQSARQALLGLLTE